MQDNKPSTTKALSVTPQQAAGRRALWRGAFQDAVSCLDLARRAEAAMPRCATYGSQILGPESTTPFPSQMDCSDVTHHLREYAIIRFCAVFTKGFGSGDDVLSNPKQDKLIEKFSERCEQLGHVKSDVLALITKLMELRNSAIAHLDGNSFSVFHHMRPDAPDSVLMTRMNPKKPPLENADFKLFEAVAYIGLYINLL